jgi:hypothetical protein
MYIGTRVISIAVPLLWRGMTSSPILAVATAAATYFGRVGGSDLLTLAFGLGRGLASSPANPILLDFISANGGLPGRIVRVLANSDVFSAVIRITGGAVFIGRMMWSVLSFSVILPFLITLALFSVSSMGWALNTLTPVIASFIGVLPVWSYQAYDLLLSFIIEACGWMRTEINPNSVRDVSYMSSLILSISEALYYFGPSLETSLSFFQISVDIFCSLIGYFGHTGPVTAFFMNALAHVQYYGILVIQFTYASPISYISSWLLTLNELITPWIGSFAHWSVVVFDWITSFRR